MSRCGQVPSSPALLQAALPAHQGPVRAGRRGRQARRAAAPGARRQADRGARGGRPGHGQVGQRPRAAAQCEAGHRPSLPAGRQAKARGRRADTHLRAARRVWSRIRRCVATRARSRQVQAGSVVRNCGGNAALAQAAQGGRRSRAGPLSRRTGTPATREVAVPGVLGGRRRICAQTGLSESLGARHVRGGRRACESLPHTCGADKAPRRRVAPAGGRVGLRLELGFSRGCAKWGDVAAFWASGANAAAWPGSRKGAFLRPHTGRVKP